MSEFVVNTDMFGQYVRIPTGYSRKPHIYKVVSLFQSNTYCDVPIVAASAPVPHKKEFTGLDSLEYVLNVIHCGIDESKVIRVALKDCEIVEMQTSASEELQQYREIGTVEECREEKRFKEYFDELYGTGLEVENWHENGNTEPFDNFYDAAIDGSKEK